MNPYQTTESAIFIDYIGLIFWFTKNCIYIDSESIGRPPDGMAVPSTNTKARGEKQPHWEAPPSCQSNRRRAAPETQNHSRKVWNCTPSEVRCSYQLLALKRIPLVTFPCTLIIEDWKLKPKIRWSNQHVAGSHFQLGYSILRWRNQLTRCPFW